MLSRQEEMREKAKHRGRVYQCLACYYKKDISYISKKLKIEEHIYKNHVRPDEIPCFCRQCKFQCMKWEQLVRHMSNYATHANLVKKKGYSDQEQSFLTKSSSPYRLGPTDYIRLESEDSIRHWISDERGAETRPGQLIPGHNRTCNLSLLTCFCFEKKNHAVKYSCFRLQKEHKNAQRKKKSSSV